MGKKKIIGRVTTESIHVQAPSETYDVIRTFVENGLTYYVTSDTVGWGKDREHAIICEMFVKRWVPLTG